MAEYQNGGYHVKIDIDGTKTRTATCADPVPEYPESIDVKVTNECDAGCAYCHEKSVPDGLSFNVNDAHRLFFEVPISMELAIGGGNPLVQNRDLKWLVRTLSHQRPYNQQHIFNVTVNSRHLKNIKDYDDLPPCTAIGISYMRGLHDEIIAFTKDGQGQHHHSVIHVIAGVQTLDDMKACLRDFDRILVLGFKKWGRGETFNTPTIDKAVAKWRDGIGAIIQAASTIGKIVAFDNLGVEQLGIARFFTDENWKKVYMGDDGRFSMYLDLVKMEYAKASFAPDRFPIGTKTIKEMFKHLRSI